MTKYDKIALTILTVAAVIFTAMNHFFEKKEGYSVEVSRNGIKDAIYAIGEEQHIAIGDGNELEIINEQVDMVWADCPDQLCVKQKAIRYQKETIVCLPNQIVVEIVGEQAVPTDIDGIVY